MIIFTIFLLFGMKPSATFSRDSLMVEACDTLIRGHYGYQSTLHVRGEVYSNAEGGVSRSGPCLRIAKPWQVPIDSMGLETWEFNFYRGSLMPLQIVVWKSQNSIVVADSVVEVSAPEGGECGSVKNSLVNISKKVKEK